MLIRPRPYPSGLVTQAARSAVTPRHAAARRRVLRAPAAMRAARPLRGVLVLACLLAATSAATSDDVLIATVRGRDDLDVHRSATTKRCRREAHDALFAAESARRRRRDDAAADEFFCASALREPEAACRVAAAATTCRLERGRARARSAPCVDARHCERCIARALGRGETYRSSDDADDDEDDEETMKKKEDILPDCSTENTAKNKK